MEIKQDNHLPGRLSAQVRPEVLVIGGNAHRDRGVAALRLALNNAGWLGAAEPPFSHARADHRSS